MIVPPLLHHQHAWSSSLRIHHGVPSGITVGYDSAYSSDLKNLWWGIHISGVWETHSWQVEKPPRNELYTIFHKYTIRWYRYCKKEECMQWLKLGLISSCYAFFMPSLLSVVGKRVLWHPPIFEVKTPERIKRASSIYAQTSLSKHCQLIGPITSHPHCKIRSHW